MKMILTLYFIIYSNFGFAQFDTEKYNICNTLISRDYDNIHPDSHLISIDSAKVVDSKVSNENYVQIALTITNNSLSDLHFLGTDSIAFADLYEVLALVDNERLVDHRLSAEAAKRQGDLMSSRFGTLPMKYKFDYIGNYSDKDYTNRKNMSYIVVPKNSTTQFHCLIPKPTQREGDYKIELQAKYFIKKERYIMPSKMFIHQGVRIYFSKD